MFELSFVFNLMAMYSKLRSYDEEFLFGVIDLRVFHVFFFLLSPFVLVCFSCYCGGCLLLRIQVQFIKMMCNDEDRKKLYIFFEGTYQFRKHKRTQKL